MNEIRERGRFVVAASGVDQAIVAAWWIGADPTGATAGEADAGPNGWIVYPAIMHGEEEGARLRPSAQTTSEGDLESASFSTSALTIQLPPLKPQDPWPGRLVGGRFRICERLGTGGMAVVYRAEEQGLIRRDVAIKLLTPESALSQPLLARFLKEAQVIANIRHANVVQVLDVGRTDDGHLYLAMELLLGKTLQEVIRDVVRAGQVFSWQRTADITLQVCAALRAAHRHKVVHRDIKPSNCFCIANDDDEDIIKLLDFGIAKAQAGGDFDEEAPLTQVGMFLGTPHYAAPEVIDHHPDRPIDGRADIFAVGVMMYQMLTGSLPFRGASRVEVLYKTVHEQPPSPRMRAPERNIPPDVDALVMTAMAKDPDERFETAGALVRAIRATLESLRPNTLPPRDSGLAWGTETLASGESIQDSSSSMEMPASESWRRGQPSLVRAVGTVHYPEDATPLPPGERAPMSPSTAASPRGPDAAASRSSRKRVGALAAVTGALVALGALVIYEQALPGDGAATPPAAVVQTPTPTPTPTPTLEQPVTKPAPEPAPSEAPVPVEPAPAQPVPEVVAPTKAPAERPAADPLVARKQQVRERIKALMRGEAVMACVPKTVLLGDGEADTLPVVVSVDAQGRTRGAVSGSGKRSVPKSADPCILALIDAQRFTPATAPVQVPLTLSID